MKPPPRWLQIIALAGNAAYMIFGDYLPARLACALFVGWLLRSLIADD